jgi:hypothetical protein
LLLTRGAIIGPALGVWRGRQDGFPITGYCILAKQQQAAAVGLVALRKRTLWTASEDRPARMQSCGERRAATIGVIQMSPTRL